MADRVDNIKTRLSVEGEKEYREACRGIDSDLKLLGTEMKVVTAQFGANAKSTEALAAKGKVLDKELDEQKKKVAAAEEALKKMAEQGLDATDPRYKKMQQNLNNAKAAMYQTETAIEKNNAELKKSKKQLSDGESGWKKFGEAAGKAAKKVGEAAAALGTAAAAAATALGAMTVSAAKDADELRTLSANTHISTDDLQKYSYALNFVDGDLETLTKAMTKTTKAMDSARNGTGAAAEGYARLGISVTDANGELRNNQDVFWEVIDALGQIENETERDALAMELLGKSGTELNTIINAGSAAFMAYGEEAEKMGVVMGEETVATLGKFDDKVQKLTASFDGLKNNAGLIALPFLDTIADGAIPLLGEFSTGIQEAAGDMSKLGEVIGGAVSGALNLLVESLPEFIAMGLSLIIALVEGVTSPESIATIATAVSDIITTLCTSLEDLLPMIIQGGLDLVIALAEGIGGSLDELIPSVIATVMKVVEVLTNSDNISRLINAALQIIIAFANGLVKAIPEIVKRLPTIIKGLIDGLLGEGLPQIIECGIELIGALLSDIPSLIAAVVTSIPDILNAIFSALGKGIAEMARIGLDLIKGLWNGISDAAAWLWDKVSGWCGQLWGKIKNFFGIHSPSKRAEDEVGAQLPPGISRGFEKKTPAMINSVTGNLKKLSKAMQREVNVMNDDIARVSMEGVYKNMTGIASKINIATASAAAQLPRVAIASMPAENERTIGLLEAYLPAIAAANKGNYKVVLDKGVLVGEMIDDIDEKLGHKLRLKKRYV